MEITLRFHKQIQVLCSKKREIKTLVKNEVPERGGVYYLMNDGIVFYVGRSTNFQQRLLSHVDGHLLIADEIALQFVDDVPMQNVVEAVAIAEFMPEFNTTGKII